MASIGEQFRPGNKVPHSGIYLVTHGGEHAPAHEVTCAFGSAFPHCAACGRDARFNLIRAAQHIDFNDNFISHVFRINS